MQRTIVACDRCGAEFRPNTPTEGVTNAYISCEANGSAKTMIVEAMDYCRSCWSVINVKIAAATQHVARAK